MTVPSLRDLYDAAEKRLTPAIEAVVHSEEFATTTAIIGMVRREASKRIEDANAALWHLVNIPAGSDVRKLRRQIGELDYEVRQLRLELGEQAHHVDRSHSDEESRDRKENQ